MALKTREKTFKDSEGNDINVSSVSLPGEESFEIQAELLKIVAIGGMSAMSGKKKPSNDSMLDSDISFSSTAGLLNIIQTKLTAKEMLKFVKRILQTTYVNGNQSLSEKTVFDEIFSGEMSLMYEVTFFALEVNFASFFGKNGIGRFLSSLEKMPMLDKIKNMMKQKKE